MRLSDAPCSGRVHPCCKPLWVSHNVAFPRLFRLIASSLAGYFATPAPNLSTEATRYAASLLSRLAGAFIRHRCGGPQPQRGVGRLHRLPHHPLHVAAQGLQIGFFA